MSGIALLCLLTLTFAAPVVREASGANPAAIQAAVDQFRQDLGGNNSGAGGSFATGRHEIKRKLRRLDKTRHSD